MTQLRINIAGIKIVKKVANERWYRKESSQRKMVEKKVANERWQKKESSQRKMVEKKVASER